MRRCIVVGGSGFLGGNLLDLGPEWKVIGTAHSRPKGDLLQIDLREPCTTERQLADLRPDVLVYAAGLTSVESCERVPEEAHYLNSEAPARLARALGCRMIYVSTDYTFDGRDGCYAESHEVRPVNVYGHSKARGEAAVLAENPLNAVLRVSGLFDAQGTKEGPFDGDHQAEPVYAQDDRISSPVHVRDVRRALQMILNLEGRGVFHAGGPQALTRYEFRQLVALHRGSLHTILPAPRFEDSRTAARPRDSSLLSERLAALGWSSEPVANWFPSHNGDRVCGNEREALSLIGPDVDGVILDCVGGLLGRRNAVRSDAALDLLDARCEQTLDSETFWHEASGLMSGCTSEQIQRQIADRYAPNPAIWGLLPALRKHVPIALVNNGPSATFRLWIRKYGLDRFFGTLINSEEIGTRKPAPGFFLHAARALGAAPARCLVIDDNATYLAGAEHCGMRAARTTETASPGVSSFVFDDAIARRENMMTARLSDDGRRPIPDRTN